MRSNDFKFCFRVCIATVVCGTAQLWATQPLRNDRIKIYEQNQFYWQCKDKPVLLLGATDDDNIFQWPELEMISQLDVLVKAGGNYDRCTMSWRQDRGCEVQPYRRLDSGKYNLDVWNSEFWRRFSRYLQECNKREVIVQIEVWSREYVGRNLGEKSAFNPDNNINYDSSILARTGPPSRNKFYKSIPELENNSRLLEYQKAYVDKVLSYTFRYDNVLYTVENEYNYWQPLEWSRYWAEYIKKKAAAKDKHIYVTEMNQTDWGMRAALKNGRPFTEDEKARLGGDFEFPYSFNKNHKYVYDHPEIYDYIDFSDNANSFGQTHWDNLQAVRKYISRRPRPINHDKIYGADFGFRWTTSEGIDLFWRDIIGGAASARFHRPPMGIGQNQYALASIRAMRKFERWVKPWQCEPRMDLLTYREENEAYLIANPKKGIYGLYFTGKEGDGWVRVNFGRTRKRFVCKWLDITSGEWGREFEFTNIEPIVVTPPTRSGDYGWAAVIVER